MKMIKYNMRIEINNGTEENPQIEEIFVPVAMSWNENNEKIAQEEAYNGEYTIEDATNSNEAKIIELKK